MSQQPVPSPSPQPVGYGVFCTAFFLLSLTGLLLLPTQTKQGLQNQGWWTQPWLMPSLALGFMCATAGYLALDSYRKARAAQPNHHTLHTLGKELVEWLKPFEFFLYYIGYIWLLGLVGYGLSTLIFMSVLSLRVGLRSRKWLVAVLLTTIILVALFRLTLRVWIPPAELYELFPKEIRNFLIRNL